MKRFLITTADERTWPKDQPVLFLGEWCKLYDRRHVWAAMDAEMVPYHWNDRKKLYRDYIFLQDLYEDLLLELSEWLNSYHGVKHTLRYWRILIGPWLGYFVQMLFDRWEMIQRAVADYSIDGVRVLGMVPTQMVPNDMDNFEQLYVGDAWNEVIYGQFLQGWTTVPIEKMQPAVEQCHLPALQPVMTPLQQMKYKMVRAAVVVSQMFTKVDDVFFMATYLPIQQDFLLQWRLGQVPKIWCSIPTPKAEVDWTKRQWQMEQTGGGDFPAIIKTMIPRHIPALYVEGYEKLQSLCGNLPWPKKPRLIFTSNNDNSDDVFKAWAAEKVEAGVPLVIGQHGGNYGIGRWEFTEEHQCAISDGYLSWGWSDENRPQIKPVGNFKIVDSDMGWDPEGRALVVESIVPRYSYRMFSVSVAAQWLDYFEDQCHFVAALPEWLRSQLVVRLHHHDYGWCAKQRWRDRFPELQLDDGVMPIALLVKKSRLYISTYNATTFLESLAMNIPTVMFWNPNHWELRDSAVPYFERLKTVGIFHETPESAAHKMTMVWDDVGTWWNSAPIQAVREEFCYRYSRMPEQPLEDLEQVLNRISKAAIE